MSSTAAGTLEKQGAGILKIFTLCQEHFDFKSKLLKIDEVFNNNISYFYVKIFLETECFQN